MILLLNSYRAIVHDKVEGIVVLDITADSDAEAMGRARTAAETHLKCNAVTAVVVKKHTELPAEWLQHKDRKIH